MDAVAASPSRRNDEFDNIIKYLASTYQLPLRVHKDVSPDKRRQESNPCFEKLRFLYFKDSACLVNIIKAFEGIAANFLTEWINKPNQEPGTLPPLRPKKMVLAKFVITQSQGKALMEKLDQCLDAPVAKYRRTVFTGGASFPSPAAPAPAQAALANSFPQSDKTTATSKGSTRKSGGKLKQTSITKFVVEFQELTPGPTDESRNSEAAIFNSFGQQPPGALSASFLKRSSGQIPWIAPSIGRAVAGESTEEDNPSKRYSSPPSPSPAQRERRSSKEVGRLAKFQKERDVVPVISPRERKRPSTDNPEDSASGSKSRRLRGKFGQERVAVNSYSPKTEKSFTSKPRMPLIEPWLPTQPIQGMESSKTSFNTSFASTIFSAAPHNSQLTSLSQSFATNKTDSFVGKISKIDLDDDLPSSNDYGTPLDFETIKQAHQLAPSQELQKMTLEENIPSSSFDTGTGIEDAVRFSVDASFHRPPFDDDFPVQLEAAPFHIRYEICRIAQACRANLSSLAANYKGGLTDYAELWNWFRSQYSLKGTTLPEQTRPDAWAAANDKGFENISLAGDFCFSTIKNAAGNSVQKLEFKLKPMNRETTSYRLARRFGSDRFLVVGLPALSGKSGAHLRTVIAYYLDRKIPSPISKCKGDTFQEEFYTWFLRSTHRFAGRSWRAFYAKDKGTKASKAKKSIDNPKDNKDASLASMNQVKHLVYLFAQSGCDILKKKDSVVTKAEDRSQHLHMSVHKLWEWFFCFDRNLSMTCCKAFARMALGVSKTYPTITFSYKLGEIVRVKDIYGDVPFGSKDGKRKVMNDETAIAIRDVLELDDLPSAFQGRIAGAKGLWIVNPDPKKDENRPRRWIEISDSQEKFKKHWEDFETPDEGRVTLEVNKWSKPLEAASLSKQYIPILIDRGVKVAALGKLLADDLNNRSTKQRVSLADPVLFRKWNQDNCMASIESIKQPSDIQLGIPESRSEKINFLLESGFHPNKCNYLAELARSSAHEYCENLYNSLKISVGSSTRAFCVADPLGVLADGEVHFGFSSSFKDPLLDFADTMLHNREVLVGRNPAHLPSDIQKVRAVFNSQLQSLKDVIVFSTKGSQPLADMLSGGDYDGDEVWVCWDRSLVDSFRNAPLPANPPSAEELGIKVDRTTLAEIKSKRRISKFLSKGLMFAITDSLLGIASDFHERMCYAQDSIRSSGAITMATLLGHLVDTSKNGYIFTNEDFHKLKMKTPGIQRGGFPPPAYKDDGQKPKGHINDYLKFKVAKGIIDTCLADLTKQFPQTSMSYDPEVVRLWTDTSKLYQDNKEVTKALSDMISQINRVKDFWKANIVGGEKVLLLAQECVSQFNKIMPPKSLDGYLQSMKHDAERSYLSNWKLLRASAAFSKHPDGKFIWYIAGREVGQLKATQSDHVTIVRPIHLSYKPCPKYIKRLENKKFYEVAGDDGDELENEGISTV
ncbi:MAG: hypothetical protein M1829_000347 [Trizodia sp. TS-e1964]|nr:MAG: hypothetical protein M1829_000347 [Trizodia sp. TS-e1964]